MNSQYKNHNNQSTVEIVTAISNMFFKQSEIKHIHTIGVVVVKICVYLLDILCPRQHNKGRIELANEPTPTGLGQA